MTRKRTRENLQALLCRTCPYCDGRGRIKAVETVGHELLRHLQQEAARGSTPHITASVHPEVATYLCAEAPRGLEAIEQQFHTKIVVKAVEGFHREQVEITTGD
jgi:ribonuclease G